MPCGKQLRKNVHQKWVFTTVTYQGPASHSSPHQHKGNTEWLCEMLDKGRQDAASSQQVPAQIGKMTKGQNQCQGKAEEATLSRLRKSLNLLSGPEFNLLSSVGTEFAPWVLTSVWPNWYRPSLSHPHRAKQSGTQIYVKDSYCTKERWVLRMSNGFPKKHLRTQQETFSQ